MSDFIEMDVEKIIEFVSRVDASKGDYEVAHSMEDELYAEFILFVSKSDLVPKHIQEMAELVLTTKDLDFERYCA